ncbi:glycosyl hydrolase family 28-related protein [Stutzerimonas stutzeri]|uniref:glycosyl hydrolase family 28-related protein n=1 Tax=Stutzerimonas stutzeri TaxID=316 RepID=UPI0034D6EE24
MTFNTGNNVPSTDPRDLYDNAENLDKLVNGADPFYADRKGVLRESWAGMENSFNNAQEGRETAFTLSQADKESRFQAFLVSSGYVSKGDYAAGVVLAERNEYVAVDAATTGTTAGLYRPGPGATLPLTLTGTWATDSASLVLLGDDVLRQELAGISPNDGAAIVGRAIRFFRSIRLVGGGDGELLTVAGQYDGETVQVLGYWDDMPGEGGGLYTWFATNTLPADGAVIVAPGGVTAGRWIMRPRETYFEDFGARGDGVTDDFAAMNLAVTSIYSKMFPVRMKSRTYASSQMLVVGDKVSLIGSGTFVSMIRALPGFVGTAVVQYYAPDSGINSVEIKNFRVSCNGQDVHGFDLLRMYDAVLISGLMCIDAPDTKNAFRLVGHTDAAPITIGQTVRIEALFMGHANSTATAATCYIQKLQEAVFTECKSWGCYGSSKAASVPWEIEDCRSLTFIQPSAVTSTGYGFKIRSIGRTTRNINLISPLYENIDGMIDAQGADANFIVINVRQENPRYETVTTGGYNFAFTNSCEVDLFNRPATVASTAVQTLLYTGDASSISNSSTTTTILRRANAVSGRYSVGPALEVTAQDGSTVHFRTLEPSANTCSMMVAHNNGSTTTLKQVLVGAADSAGTGFRTLRIAN